MIQLDKEYIYKKDIMSEVTNSLNKDNYNYHLTINTNYLFQTNQRAIEKSFILAKRISHSFLNDFGGKGRYFMRLAQTQSLHYHILLQVNEYHKLRKTKTQKYGLKKINSAGAIAEYLLAKQKDIVKISRECGFKGASVHLSHIAPDEAQRAVKAYVAYNKHNPTALRNVDLAKHFAGDASFAYATSDMTKKSA